MFIRVSNLRNLATDSICVLELIVVFINSLDACEQSLQHL